MRDVRRRREDRENQTMIEGNVALTGRADGTVRIVGELRRGWYFFALGPLADGTDRGEYEVLAAHYFLQDRSTLCDHVHPFKVTPSTSPARTLLTRWNAAEHCGIVSLCETCRAGVRVAAHIVFRVDVGAIEPVVLGPKPSRRSRRRKQRRAR